MASGAEIKERLAALSPRERQVLDRLVAGHHNKTIAHKLEISARTSRFIAPTSWPRCRRRAFRSLCTWI